MESKAKAKKQQCWFPHDFNARNDPKIQSLINKYGLSGYGRFWIIIEMMRESSNYELETEEYVFESMANQMKCSVDDVKSFIEDCCNKYKLFIKTTSSFYSNSLKERMASYDSRIEGCRKGAETTNRLRRETEIRFDD